MRSSADWVPGGGSAILPEQQDSVGPDNKPNQDEPRDWGHESHCLEPPTDSCVRFVRDVGTGISLTQDQKSTIDLPLLRLKEPMFSYLDVAQPIPLAQSKYGAAPRPEETAERVVPLRGPYRFF
jgi:hypothetical protein